METKFDFTNLLKYLTSESAGGRILTFCMYATQLYSWNNWKLRWRMFTLSYLYSQSFTIHVIRGIGTWGEKHNIQMNYDR